MLQIKNFLKIFIPISILVSIGIVWYVLGRTEVNCGWWKDNNCEITSLGFSADFGVYGLFYGLPIAIFVTWIILFIKHRSPEANPRKERDKFLIILPIIIISILLYIIYADYEMRERERKMKETDGHYTEIIYKY